MRVDSRTATGGCAPRRCWGAVYRGVVSAAVAAVVLAALAVPANGTPLEPGGLGNGLRLVDRLPIVSPPERGTFWQTSQVRLILNPLRRRAYMFFSLHPQPVPRVGIRSYDLDTLEPLGFVKFDSPRTYLGEIELVTERGIILFRTAPHQIGVLSEDAIAAGRDPLVRTIEIPEDQRLLLRPVEDDNASSTISSFTVYERDGRAKLLLGLTPHAPFIAGATAGIAGATLPFLAQWDLETGEGDWLLPIEACRNGRRLVAGVPVMIARDLASLYTVCNVANGLGAVVRVALGPDGAPDEASEPEVFPGPIDVLRTFEDTAAERFLMISKQEGAFGHTLWVFDGSTSRYAGISGLTQGTSSSPSFGFDPSIGRLYVQAADHLVGDLVGPDQIPVPGGLMMVDTRLTPVPQPAGFPALARPSDVTIAVDPATPGRPRRVFVRRAIGSEWSPTRRSDPDYDYQYVYPDGKSRKYLDERFFLVLEETVPEGRQPSIGAQDRLTIDVDEREGITSASYDANGSAYGARAMLVGGIGALVRTQAEVLEYQFDRQGYLPACWHTGRDVFVGAVPGTRLTDYEASASARAGDANESSIGDVSRPTERCASAKTREVDTSAVDDVIGRGWPYSPVECVGNEGETVSEQPGSFTASVACGFDDGAVDSSASGALAATGGVSIGESESSVRVRRDAIRGVVVTTSAAAHGIRLPGGISIGIVRSEAEVWSNGRVPAQDAERARLTRQLCFVRTPTYTQEGCVDPSAAIDAMNRALGRRGKVSMPRPDSAYERGSPGGYVAGITKNRPDAIDDQLFNGDQRLEVPALQIVFYRDTSYFGPGRQIIQLAAVQAVATYGIQCVPPFTFMADEGDCVEGTSGASGPIDPGPISTPGPDANPTGAPDDERDGDGRTGPLPPVLEVVKDILVRSLGEGLLLSLVWLTLGAPFVLARRGGHLAKARRA